MNIFMVFNSSMMRTLTSSLTQLTVYTDSLISLYQHQDWFKSMVDEENELLLKAIQTPSIDSAKRYLYQFVVVRSSRYFRFIQTFGKDISKAERFWEKTEGTARYVEYQLGLTYHKLNETMIPELVCDTLFQALRPFKDQGFNLRPWFTEKEQIMPAYFYVTGFNLCRIHDKMQVDYKTGFFENNDNILDKFDN